MAKARHQNQKETTTRDYSASSKSYEAAVSQVQVRRTLARFPSIQRLDFQLTANLSGDLASSVS